MIIFIIVQMLNVVISTFKSVLTIRGTKISAAIINSIAYSVNIIVVYFVSKEIGLLESISITFLTNLTGVYIGLTLLDKIRKDRLWRIQCTVPTYKLQDFKEDLLRSGIKFIGIETTWEEYKLVDIFSRNREESKIVKDIIVKHKAKYTISANSNYL